MKTKERLKKDTGLVLRGLRESKSQEEDVIITQSDIADYAHICLRYYNKLENGMAVPSLDVLMKIASAYKMPAYELCKRIEEY